MRPPPPPSALYTTTFLLALLTTLLLAFTLRLLAILPSTRRSNRPPPRPRGHTARVLIVLGSGGHTHEMLSLLRDLDPRKYTHRTWVVSSGDGFSAGRARAFEEGLEERWKSVVHKQEEEEEEEERRRGEAGRDDRPDTGTGTATATATATARRTRTIPLVLVNGSAPPASSLPPGAAPTDSSATTPILGPSSYTIHTLPRARAIHQPLLTTPFTSLQTLFHSLTLLLQQSPSPPDLILTNGPATSVLVVLAALILRFFDVKRVESRGLLRTVYVESFARVETLSLSARVVGGVVDRFLVQWEGVAGRGWGGRGEFVGVLVG